MLEKGRELVKRIPGGAVAQTGLLILVIGALVLVLLWQPLFTAENVTQSPARMPSVPEAGPVVLTDSQEQYSLGLHMEVLEDASGELTIEDVTSLEFDSEFAPSQVETPIYGYTAGAYWVRFTLQNEARSLEPWLLQVRFPNMHHVDLFTGLPDGTGYTVKRTGVLMPLSTRDLLVPWIVFKLALPSAGGGTFYMRFQTGSSMELPLTVWSTDAFQEYSVWRQILFAVFLGALLGLALFNLLVLAYIRDINYLFIAIVMIGIMIQEAALAGFTELYLLPGLYAFKKYYHSIPLMAAFAAMVMFSDSVLEMKRLQPMVHRGNQVVVGGFALLAVASPWIPYHALSENTLLWAIACLLVGCLGGVMSWRVRFLPARLLLASWIAMVSTVYVIVLTKVGIFPSTLITENAYRVGFMMIGLSSSIALASRLNALRDAARSALRELQVTQARQAQVLEAMPLGVVVYGRDMRPQYFNRKLDELVNGPAQGTRADVAMRRTISQAIRHFAFKRAGSDELYPLEDTPAYRALQGVSSSVDDIEVEKEGRRIPLEAWASPLTDEAGQVEAAVLVLGDISERRQAESNVLEYRRNLEELVRARTAELEIVNQELQLHIDWLNAIGRVNEVVARRGDFSDVFERISRITKGLFGSQEAFIAEWDGRSHRVELVAHTCRHDQHLVPSGSVTRLPEKVFSGDGSAQRNPIHTSELWGDDLAVLDGPLAEHIRASLAGSVILVSMHIHQSKTTLLGLEMPGWTAALTDRETSLLRTYSIDIARVIENARLFEQVKTVAAIEERNRLARELHDSVAQALFGISLFTDATRMALNSQKPDTARNHLQELASLSREAMLDMRLLIFELRPPILEKVGLVSALQSRFDSVERKSGLRVVFHVQGEIHLAPQQEADLYRIAQEALHNITKHAKARGVEVWLTQEAGTVQLIVKDDGVGFDPEQAGQKGGQGLQSMRERADRIGGGFHIESVRGNGCKITVAVTS